MFGGLWGCIPLCYLPEVYWDDGLCLLAHVKNDAERKEEKGTEGSLSIQKNTLVLCSLLHYEI